MALDSLKSDEIPKEVQICPNFALCCHFRLSPLQSLTAPLHRGAPWGGCRLVVASQKGLSFGRELSRKEWGGDDGGTENVFNMICGHE